MSRAAAKALKTFVSSFGLPAYTVESVPDDVAVPYLTYPFTEPEWRQKATFYIQGWYRSSTNADLLEKADEILQSVGTGKTITTDSGYLVIYPDTPLVQLNVDGDFRSFYINLSINVYQVPGYYPESPSVSPVTQEPGENPEEGE